MHRAAPEVTVIGLGNTYRGDDAVGLFTAELCRQSVPATVEIVSSISDASSLLDIWNGLELCIVIDCAVSGAESGTIYRIDGLVDTLPEEFTSTFSTHALSLGQGLQLGRVLGKLPGRLLIFGIEGSQFDCGAPISPEVESSARTVSRMIAEEVGIWLKERAHD